MTKFGKFWTGAVAYVSLLVGAGLSVAGNLADTYRTRGADVDTLDKVMAAGWPILVLLAIEMFVSPRWSPARLFQVWRWVGCLAVGGMAMVVSWTHLHDLMATRGQLVAVSILGPLAIDGMAVMATGLILSTRVRGQVAMDTPDMGTDIGQAPVTDIWEDDGHGHTLEDCPDPEVLATRPDGDLSAWTSGYERALDELSADIGHEAEAFLAGQVTDKTPDTLPRRTRTPDGIPADILELVSAPEWTDTPRGQRADITRSLATKHGVHERTIRRWLTVAANMTL